MFWHDDARIAAKMPPMRGDAFAAIEEIDQVAAGTIRLTVYGTQNPRFTLFASIAAMCFMFSALAKLSVPFFQRFP